MRYVLNQNTIWQTDFVTYSLVAATFIGSPYVLMTRGHVNVDVLPHYLGSARRYLARARFAADLARLLRRHGGAHVPVLEGSLGQQVGLRHDVARAAVDSLRLDADRARASLPLQCVAEICRPRHRARAAVRHPPKEAPHEPGRPRGRSSSSSRWSCCFPARRSRSGWARSRFVSRDLPGLRRAARGRRNLLRRAERLHAGVDPDVRDDGRGDRLVARRQGPVRGARSLALPPAGRPGDLQPRRLRDLRGAHRLVARVLRRHRQDGHSGDAQARLSGRRRHRLDLRRRHARHPDPAVDHVHPLRHRHRDLDRPPVPRRRPARPDADRPVHAVDAVHHLEARLPLARARFPLHLEGEIPIDPEDRAVPRHHRRRDVRALRRRRDAVGSGRRRRGAVRRARRGHLPHVAAATNGGRSCATRRASR